MCLMGAKRSFRALSFLSFLSPCFLRFRLGFRRPCAGVLPIKTPIVIPPTPEPSPEGKKKEEGKRKVKVREIAIAQKPKQQPIGELKEWVAIATLPYPFPLADAKRVMWSTLLQLSCTLASASSLLNSASPLSSPTSLAYPYVPRHGYMDGESRTPRPCLSGLWK